MKNGDMPAIGHAGQISAGTFTSPDVPGLTKRELIAAMVLQGFAADSSAGGTTAELAIQAVEWADSLLAALERAP
ncbi:hypothetical protein [Stenotrophomonas maltophilia]|uniref:hypothetical protein n=1 Tax=Stenotrophomonas maltophilia group TaxID=995085 RepID=UPI00070CF392|nr:hypothetical protein [Stenotrophomonas maltophilia]KRG61572.1 hypothetical protein ARC02_02525 [Stenotrophomonas maltophilia]NNH46647.1 hypothetical protein [Stenotrophomonas maltophilia]VEE52147.1 Uncharacterised protein [Stenotrophomonas maltophilia]